MRRLNYALFHTFTYAQSETQVDSPIDDALKARAGVCQDLAHIMIALARRIGIPCRYVSGYLSPSTESHDRSAEGATHAWAEAYLPTLGWVGFDPTNDVLAAERHIRVAVGRDYADVPPTRGVFRGEAGSELSVLVTVSLADAPIRPERVMPMTTWVAPEVAEPPTRSIRRNSSSSNSRVVGARCVVAWAQVASGFSPAHRCSGECRADLRRLRCRATCRARDRRAGCCRTRCASGV